VTWNQRYRLRRFAGDSLWLLPLLGALTVTERDGGPMVGGGR